jgi:hypothetical protein
MDGDGLPLPAGVRFVAGLDRLAHKIEHLERAGYAHLDLRIPLGGVPQIERRVGEERARASANDGAYRVTTGARRTAYADASSTR